MQAAVAMVEQVEQEFQLVAEMVFPQLLVIKPLPMVVVALSVVVELRQEHQV
jgi:hypothetical protein